MSDAFDPIYVAALVAYRGGAYKGFQVQATPPTVQGALEAALARCVGWNEAENGPLRLTASGRTDTGVHARGQVIAAWAPWQRSVGALMQAWNAHLPDDIVIRRLVRAKADFHPRFSALSRTYRYTVVTTASPASLPPGEALPEAGRQTGRKVRPPRSPLTDATAFHEPRTLDLTAMQRGAAFLIGEHDFATFGRPPQGESTVRRVCQAEWRAIHTDLPVLGEDDQRTLVFTISANAFLQRMVRNVVGTLLQVGLGQRAPEEVAELLAARDRSRSGPPAAPRGLSLEHVDYPAEVDPFL